MKIEVIRQHLEEPTDFVEIWRPFIKSSFKDEEIQTEICRYAHSHSLMESFAIPMQNAATTQNPLAGRTILPNPVSNPTIVSLPLCLKILSRVDFTGKTLYAVDSPAFVTLVGDEQRFVEVAGESFFFEFPEMMFTEIQTNLPEIYEKRMIEKFVNDIENYISSIPNADILFLYTMQVEWWLDSGNINRTGKVMLKLRMSVVNEEDFITNPKSKKVIITSTPTGSSEWKSFEKRNLAHPSIFLKKNPTRFQKLVAKIFFKGSSIYLK